MEPQEPKASSSPAMWLVLAGVFIAAVAITLIIGTRGDDSAQNEFPDLGDIATNDPDLPSNDEAAPTFALPTFDGSSFDLSQHVANDGRPVILNLWASWCPPCRAEMPDISTSSEQHPEVQFIGIAVDDTEEAALAFAEEINVSYPLGFDEGSVKDSYPVLGLPATFYINGDGTLAKSHFGVVTVESLDDEIAELFGL